MERRQPDAPTVMIVDDFEAVRIVLRMQLTVLGYRVLEARNGCEAVEECSRQVPDLILMDISMPQLDGLEATRILRANEMTRNVPVVALTAFADEEARGRALDAGCDDFESKPIEMSRFAALVARNLRDRGRTPPDDRPDRGEKL